MIIPTQPNFTVVSTADYRETYANSVQVRVNVWDFFLVFGTMQQQSENQVEVRNFQGIYLSPQQAKALAAILQQNVNNYESTFGEIKLDPRGAEWDHLDSDSWIIPDFLFSPDRRPSFPDFPSLFLG
jgi:hypothetical protein